MLPIAAASCERVMRAIIVTSAERSRSALSRSVPASAAAVIDGCLVASVKPNNCITMKLPA